MVSGVLCEYDGEGRAYYLAVCYYYQPLLSAKRVPGTGMKHFTHAFFFCFL